MSYGSICHIEFSTPDLAKTRAFYEDVFGWKTIAMGEVSDYVLFSPPDGVGGGFAHTEGTIAGPLVHIEIDDIDSTLSKIVKLGGKTITPKTKISDEYSYYAVALDNVGNRIGLWSRS